MRMRIDKSRRYDLAVGIDHLRRVAIQDADSGYLLARYRHIRSTSVSSGTVHQSAPFNK